MVVVETAQRAASVNIQCASGDLVETKPFFRDAFKRSRCLIPASGYYEWKATPGGKQPYYFTRRERPADDIRRAMGRMERSRDWPDLEVVHNDRHRAHITPPRRYTTACR